ncbi:hypothetical protein QCA50_013094 [Cerrena zonata]|uniref:C2H2-type domain-containing protein n=1 Tax=Cerrena zonata TaxID=2478898 RepID=A0AAW0G1C3_9APHY
MTKTRPSRKGNALCPLCSKSMGRGVIGKHLRDAHGGPGGNENVTVQGLCPWPDCGLKPEGKNATKTHLFLHTDDRAKPCPHSKKATNGDWIRCRNKLFNHGQMMFHKRSVHGWDMHKNDSIDPWMDPIAPFDCTTAKGGNLEHPEVVDSKPAESSSRTTEQSDTEVPITSGPVPDLLSTLEGLIPIKTEDIDDSELLK